MNLYNPMTTINKMVKALDHPYKGRVVQVEDDPNYIGRIKVDIPELYGEYEQSGEQSTAGILPWVYPRFLGRFSGILDFGVPEVGEIVEVEFPYKNVYLGYYTNKPLYKDLKTKLEALGDEGLKISQALFGEHYPYVYGHIDKNLTGWYVDKVTNEIFIVQGGQKANIHFDPEGSLVVSSPKNLIFNAGESIIMNSMTSIEMTTETIASACTGYTLQAETIDTKGTWNHDGTLTSTGDQVAGTISTMNHTHKYTAPAHGAGQADSAPPTP